ncbi:MAG: ABC transporter ATP-binding protein [Candidatus Eisenbacteria bacterium]|nr:ABC transporter ATP-binding protein [Candidatus Eisenbacteria bacterium]
MNLSPAPRIAGTVEAAVSARGLTRRFGSFTAVDGIDLDVAPGEIFGFLGANGAGKTTAIRMLCGLLRPTAGSATVAGCRVGPESSALRRRIGYMSQRFSLYEDLTVRENMAFFGGVYGLSPGRIRDRAAALLPQLGLSGREDRLAGALPLGYKQRLALGSALLHEPRVLFLDEPTGGVDPLARRSFWDLIYARAAAGTTVFVTTHYMDEAEYCGRVSIMIEGRIVALDTPAGLKRSTGGKDMQDVFLRLVDR